MRLRNQRLIWGALGVLLVCALLRLLPILARIGAGILALAVEMPILDLVLLLLLVGAFVVLRTARRARRGPIDAESWPAPDPPADARTRRLADWPPTPAPPVAEASAPAPTRPMPPLDSDPDPDLPSTARQ